MGSGDLDRLSRGDVEPRLRRAIDANVGWHEDLLALHGVGSTLAHGLWSALGRPPPLHADAIAVEPSVTLDQVTARLDGRPHGAFKDSFGAIDATDAGMKLLFAATWIHQDPEVPRDRPTTNAWSGVRTSKELAEWTSHHDTEAVLLPGLLERAHITILARRERGAIVAGAVARLGSGVVDVSNVYAVPGHAVNWAELATAIGRRFPGRPLVGYEHGEDLEAAMAGGFDPVGDLRVWVR